MLDTAATEQLAHYLALVREPIELAASLDDAPLSHRVGELLDEIAAQSDRITVVEEVDERTPSFAIRRPGTDISVRFAGLPMGHEFSSLVLALVQVGGHEPKVDAATIAAIKALDGGDFVTYMSMTCQNCPTVVQALNTMSIINPLIRHTAVEGGAFESEILDRQILAVPAVYKDGEEFGHGRMDIVDILSLLASHNGDATPPLEDTAPFDVLIIGAGPAGATSAIYSARKALRTGIVADRVGGQVLDSASIENVTSLPAVGGSELAAKLEDHVRRHEVDLITGRTALSLAPPTSPRGLFTVQVDGGSLQSRSVIIASGAQYRRMNVPGEQEYLNKGVTFCPHCDGPLFAGRDVAVVGGGNSGIEAAIDLAAVASRVTVVEFLDSLKADEILVESAKRLANVSIMTSTRVVAVEGDGKRVNGLVIEDRNTGVRSVLPLSGVFVQIGLVPNTHWLAEHGICNPSGEIVTDSEGATSIDGLFAAGDCASTPYKQILIAMGSGATAALSAFDYLMVHGSDSEQ